MCPMRIFLFLGSLIVILVSMWAIFGDDEGLAALKREDQSWWRWFVSLWTGEFLYERLWPAAVPKDPEAADTAQDAVDEPEPDGTGCLEAAEAGTVDR